MTLLSKNNRATGNDGLSREFYEVFQNNVKILLLASINDAFIKEELSTSQKQAVVKLIEKNTETKDLLRTGDQYSAKYRPKNDLKSISNEIKRYSTLSYFI